MSDTMNTPPPGSPLGSKSVGRRDLLKIGATSAVIPAVLGPAALVEKNTGNKTASDRHIPAGPTSIGYWSGSAEDGLVHAGSLASGDEQFKRTGARVTMIGMSPGLDARGQAQLQSLAVDVNLGPATFRAWRYEDTLVQNVSAPVAFSSPVDSRTGLGFTIQSLARGLSGVPESHELRLSAGKGAFAAKLREGYYVIAVGGRTRTLRVDWSTYELVGDGTGQSLLLYRNGKPATDFAYLVVSVRPDIGSSDWYV